MPKIQINDISMYYEIHGQGEPLVFIAGFSADHFTWQFVVEKFAKQYQVILLDNRGAGQSDVPAGPYQIEQMAADVIALCTKLDIHKATFIGSSMGGCIVQALAYNYPEQVTKAIICNSAMKSISCFRIFLEAQLELLKGNAPVSAVIKANYAWVFSFNFLQNGKLDELIALTLSNPFPFTIAGYEAQYAALQNFDSRSWTDKIQVPTLVIGADEDIVLSPLLAEALAKTIPTATYYCFNNCGHLPHIEYPDQFVDVVNKFLTNE